MKNLVNDVLNKNAVKEFVKSLSSHYDVYDDYKSLYIYYNTKLVYKVDPYGFEGFNVVVFGTKLHDYLERGSYIERHVIKASNKSAKYNTFTGDLYKLLKVPVVQLALGGYYLYLSSEDKFIRLKNEGNEPPVIKQNHREELVHKLVSNNKSLSSNVNLDDNSFPIKAMHPYKKTISKLRDVKAKAQNFFDTSISITQWYSIKELLNPYYIEKDKKVRKKVIKPFSERSYDDVLVDHLINHENDPMQTLSDLDKKFFEVKPNNPDLDDDTNEVFNAYGEASNDSINILMTYILMSKWYNLASSDDAPAPLLNKYKELIDKKLFPIRLSVSIIDQPKSMTDTLLQIITIPYSENLETNRKNAATVLVRYLEAGTKVRVEDYYDNDLLLDGFTGTIRKSNDDSYIELDN